MPDRPSEPERVSGPVDVAVQVRELLKADKLHGGETTVDGRTIAQIAADTVEAEGQLVVHPIETPSKPDQNSATRWGSRQSTVTYSTRPMAADACSAVMLVYSVRLAAPRRPA